MPHYLSFNAGEHVIMTYFMVLWIINFFLILPYICSFIVYVCCFQTMPLDSLHHWEIFPLPLCLSSLAFRRWKLQLEHNNVICLLMPQFRWTRPPCRHPQLLLSILLQAPETIAHDCRIWGICVFQMSINHDYFNFEAFVLLPKRRHCWKVEFRQIYRIYKQSKTESGHYSSLAN